MPPSEGRFEIVIDNDVIRRLDLTPFHTATGITNPSSGTQATYNVQIELKLTLLYVEFLHESFVLLLMLCSQAERVP